MRSSSSPSASRSSRGSVDRAGAERREPAAGAGEVERRARPRRSTAASRCSSSATTSSTAAPSKARRVATQHVEEAVVLEAVAAPVCRTAWCSPAVHLNGVSRSSAASIQAASACGGGEGVRLERRRCGTSAGARRPRPRRRPPARRRSGSARELDVDRHVVVEQPSARAASTAATTRRALPARSSRSRSAISRPARATPQLARRGRPAPAIWPAPPVTTTDSASGGRRAAVGHVGVADHEGADELGVRLVRGGPGARRAASCERRVAGREDRGVVDQTAPGRGRAGWLTRWLP